MNLSARPLVNIVGAGINGLINAAILTSHGCRVKVFDRMPDPFKTESSYRNSFYSCTWGGLDIRHGTYLENVPYAKSFRKDVLDKDVENGGWLLRNNFTPSEKAWIEKFKEFCTNESCQNKNIASLSDINRLGLSLWLDFFIKHPKIASEVVRGSENGGEKVDLKSGKILKAFSTKELMNQEYKMWCASHELESMNILNRDEIASILNGAVNTGAISCGFEVDGLVVNIKTLCKRLIELLKESGVEFFWESGFADATLAFMSPRSRQKRVCVHTGASLQYLHKISLNAKELSDKVNLVVGLMCELNNTTKMQQGFKMQLPDPIGCINVAPSVDGSKLYVSCGLGYIGSSENFEENKHCASRLKPIVMDVIKTYFPQQLKETPSSSNIDEFFRVIARPMTFDGMPVCERVEMPSGNVIEHVFCGGTSSGGFVSAFVMADKVLGLLGKKLRKKW